MTVGITGIDHKLGSAIANSFYSVVSLEENLDGLFGCDIFVNNLAKGDLQLKLFDKVFTSWLTQPKTIVNIVSTVVFDDVNTLGSYGETKIQFINFVKNYIKQYPDKQVRVINVYPSTLSSNKSFDMFNKVDINTIARIIKIVVELPQEIEVRDISFYPTVLNKSFETDKLL